MTWRSHPETSGSPIALDSPNHSPAANGWGDQRQGDGLATIAFPEFDIGASIQGERQDSSETPRLWPSHQEEAIASSGEYATPTKSTIIRPDSLFLKTRTSAPPLELLISDSATPAGDGTPRHPQDPSWPATNSGCPNCTRMANALKRLSSLRREELVRRSHLENEEEVLQRQLDNLVKLQAQFVAITTAAISRGGLDEVVTQLGDLNLEIQEAYRSELSRRDYIVELRKELRQLIYRETTKEERLYGAIYSNDAAQSTVDTQIAVEVQADDISITSKHSSFAYPSPVQEYYDIAGDFKIARERLIVLEEEHQDEALERQALKEAGRKLMPSQKIFMEDYFNRRAELIRNFLKLKNDKFRLRRQCLDQGYTLEDDSTDEELHADNIDHSNRLWKETISRSLRSQHRASRALEQLELMLLPNLYPEDHVRSWLTQMWKAQSSTSYRDPQAMLSDPAWAESKEAFRSKELDSTTNIDGKWDHSTFEATSDAASDTVAQAKYASTGKWQGENLRKRYSSPDLFSLTPRTDDIRPAPTAFSL